MIFQEQLNEYITRLQCSGKELAMASGLSDAVISRYRKGDRVPRRESVQIDGLAKGIASLAKEKGESLGETEILQKLVQSVDEGTIGKFPAERLDSLLRALDVNASRMAKSMHYDASYFSKIRRGVRAPMNEAGFFDDICSYIISHHNDQGSREKAASLMECSSEDLIEKEQYRRILRRWIDTRGGRPVAYVDEFLKMLDSARRETTSRHSCPKERGSALFSEACTGPVYFYYGEKSRQEAEIDFISLVESKGQGGDLYLYSNLLLGERQQDLEQMKAFQDRLVRLARGGTHLHLMHKQEQSFPRMLARIQEWLPVYLTGNARAYSVGTESSDLTYQLIYSSDAGIMAGGGLIDQKNCCSYRIGMTAEEIRFGRYYASTLISKAVPFMDIYCGENAGKIFERLEMDSIRVGTRRRMLFNPDHSFVSEKTVRRILERNGFSEEQIGLVFAARERKRGRIRNILGSGKLFDVLIRVSEKSFEDSPCRLDLSESGVKGDALLTYGEYLGCLDEHAEAVRNLKNYSCIIKQLEGARRIEACVREGEHIILHPEGPDNMFMVIYSPHMRLAFEAYESAVISSV